MKAVLALEDGTVVYGVGFGAEKKGLGEIVFNTSMTGYVESLTDPSYNGQILMSTYPLIGNYNVHPEWFESDRVWVEGFVTKELCEHPSHWKGIKTVDDLLKEFSVPGIAGVDTRALTLEIREQGAMKGGLVTYSDEEPDIEKLLERVRKQPDISEQDLVRKTTCEGMKSFDVGDKLKVVLIDLGAKMSTIKNMLKRGVSILVVPAATSADRIEELEPDGIVLSNGPGNPMIATYVRETAEKLMEKYPTLGIGLGGSVLALAGGARTFKLKFGHRGNQPIKDLRTGKVHITSQNHGFTIDGESLRDTGFEIARINCNDRTVEGIDHEELPIFAVDFYPAWDTEFILDDFVKLLKIRVKGCRSGQTSKKCL